MQKTALEMPALYRFSLPPKLLKRGFWIYIWKITKNNGHNIFYVGMTGDTGSGVAQSPVNRVSAHLGFNPNNNTLRRYAACKGIDLEKCRNIDFAAFGPISRVPNNNGEAYRIKRGKIAALEKALWCALNDKQEMLNKCPSSKAICDKSQINAALRAFAPFLKKSG
jgi:hypothetical protein